MSLQQRLEQFLAWCVKRAFWRERPIVIGVAGSVGKSSTKAAIGIALGSLEPGSSVVMSPKNFNTDLGVPLAVFGVDLPRRSVWKWGVLLLKGTCTALGLLPLRGKTFVLELGTDRPGDMDRLIQMTQPHVGVLTAISPEHTEFFKTVEGVAEEEATIVRSLSENGVAVVNADDAMIREQLSHVRAKTLSFGTSEDATARLLSTNVVLDEQSPEASGLEVRIAHFGSTWDLRLTGTVGRPQAYAVAAAFATVSAIDQDDALAAKRLREAFHGMPGRMRLLEGIKRTWLIDDTYNSSPLAALSAIRDLASFPVKESARRIAALGDMLELGPLAESSHVDMGRAVAEAGIDMFIACGTLAHVAARAAREAGMAEENIFTFAKSSEAGLFIQERMRQGDVVLIKGSQGVRMERITRELLAHPDRAEGLLVRQSKEWLEKT